MRTQTRSASENGTVTTGASVPVAARHPRVVAAAIRQNSERVSAYLATMVLLGIVLATATFLALAVVAFGSRRADYSHLRHTLSELGEHGGVSPRDARLVSWWVFFPIGLALAGVAYLLDRTAGTPRSAAALAACVAVGYLVAAIFPCDPGSPLSGSVRQGVHNLGGAVEYAGGALSLFTLARESTSPQIFQAAGGVVFAALLLLSFPNPWRGLVQRIAETALFGGLALAAVSRPL